MKSKYLAVLAGTFLASPCFSIQQQDVLKSWIGAQDALLVEKWGPASATGEGVMDKTEVARVYNRCHSTRAPAQLASQSAGADGSPVCNAWIFISKDGQIVRARTKNISIGFSEVQPFNFGN